MPSITHIGCRNHPFPFQSQSRVKIPNAVAIFVILGWWMSSCHQYFTYMWGLLELNLLMLSRTLGSCFEDLTSRGEIGFRKKGLEIPEFKNLIESSTWQNQSLNYWALMTSNTSDLVGETVKCSDQFSLMWFSESFSLSLWGGWCLWVFREKQFPCHLLVGIIKQLHCLSNELLTVWAESIICRIKAAWKLTFLPHEDTFKGCNWTKF